MRNASPRGPMCFRCLLFNLWLEVLYWIDHVHLSLWYVVLVCHQYDVCENYVGSVYIGGYGGLSESRLCDFRELCPVSILVVGEKRMRI